jgi:hypothetical protein
VGSKIATCWFLAWLIFQPWRWKQWSSKTLLIFSELHGVVRARIAQSVWGVATGWTTKESEFESQWGQEFSLLHVVQTSSGAHLASCPMGTGVLFPCWCSGWGLKLTTHLQLVLRSRKLGSIHPLPHTSSWHSWAQGQLYLTWCNVPEYRTLQLVWSQTYCAELSQAFTPQTSTVGWSILSAVHCSYYRNCY